MKIKSLIGIFAALLITAALLLLLTSPLWIGWMMEYEHNKTKNAVANISLVCEQGAVEEREVWSKLGIAIFCMKDGEKQGAWQAWDGGYMHISGTYVDGKKHGTWKYFNANSEQWGTRNYIAGEEQSEVLTLLTADSVVVKKRERKLYLLKDGKRYRTYDVRLGPNPVGHKLKRDDGRTPEGVYVVTTKNENSKFYKSISLSYPNKPDLEQAQLIGIGLEDEIMIHAQPNGLGWAWRLLRLWDWTDGDIAVNNQDMDEIWELVESGTQIEITA